MCCLSSLRTHISQWPRSLPRMFSSLPTDRGIMDASSVITKEAWDRILNKFSLEEIEISDNCYNHVVHLKSACGHWGWEVPNHRGSFRQKIRLQFKISRLIGLVVKRIGIDVGDRWAQEIFMKAIRWLLQRMGNFHVCVFFRFQPNSQKVKFVIML